MSEKSKQEWRIEIGEMGNACRIFLNGEAIYPSAAELQMEVGRPSILSLKFPIYGRPGGMLQHVPTYQRGDVLVAEGIPFQTYLEVDGRRFRVVEELPPGDVNDGLFGAR